MRHGIAVDCFFAGLPRRIHPSTGPAKSASVILECENFRARRREKWDGVRTSGWVYVVPTAPSSEEVMALQDVRQVEDAAAWNVLDFLYS